MATKMGKIICLILIFYGDSAFIQAEFYQHFKRILCYSCFSLLERKNTFSNNLFLVLSVNWIPTALCHPPQRPKSKPEKGAEG